MYNSMQAIFVEVWKSGISVYLKVVRHFPYGNSNGMKGRKMVNNSWGFHAAGNCIA